MRRPRETAAALAYVGVVAVVAALAFVSSQSSYTAWYVLVALTFPLSLFVWQIQLLVGLLLGGLELPGWLSVTVLVALWAGAAAVQALVVGVIVRHRPQRRTPAGS